ncbi:MAG: lycopene cyclase domain-containing protein [Nanoarchaeota archaeon]
MVSILMFIIPTFIIYVRRKDLIVESLVTGILMVIIAAIVYTILNLIQPGRIHAFWYFKNVPNILFLNLPLDDLIWYFLAGIFIGPLYEYWQEGRLTNITKHK